MTKQTINVTVQYSVTLSVQCTLNVIILLIHVLHTQCALGITVIITVNMMFTTVIQIFTIAILHCNIIIMSDDITNHTLNANQIK